MPLPNSANHPQVKVLINHPLMTVETTVDNSHRHVDINLPEGADVDDLEILAQFISRDGDVDPAYKTMILKERVTKNAEATQPGSESPEPQYPDAAEAEAESTEAQPDGLSEREYQSPSGEQPGDASATGDDRATDRLTDGLDESEATDAPSPVSETRKRKRHF
jgi:hypothetical protein